MKRVFKIIFFIVLALVILVAAGIGYLKFTHETNWHVKENAIKSQTHPLAGFWKGSDCKDPWGWAIGPIDKDKYYISFCGPGGCFKEGTYRPNTSIVGDKEYKVIDQNTIMFYTKEQWSKKEGWSKHVRCPNNT